MYGYPYHAWPDNKHYIMIGSFIQEPEIKKPDTGAIYLWLIDNNKDHSEKSWVDKVSDIINGRQPRVFVIQYTRQMHEEIDSLEKMRNGQPMPITLIRKEDMPKTEDQGQTHVGNDNENRQEYVPYIMPDVIKIEKMAQ